MSLVRMLWLITSISSVKTSMYQIRFTNQSEAICVQLYDSMVSPRINSLEVKLNIAVELSACHSNSTMKDHPLNGTKEVLIIQLCDRCSLVEQLNVLKNTSWIGNYFAVFFAINRGSATFEHALLSYMYGQIKLPMRRSDHSKFSSISEVPAHTTFNDYDFNETIIGFIDSIEVSRLNNHSSNPFLYRLHRDNSPFDPSIFLAVTIVLIGMLIGNEWHRRIFIKKILDHSHSASTMKAKFGLIIGLLLFVCFTLLYLVDRYLTFIVEEIYSVSFMIVSTCVIYLCLERICCLFIERFDEKKDLDLISMQQWSRLILVPISFTMVVFWFLYRMTYAGFILTNLIVFCLAVVMVAQMRVVNLMMCLIILGFVWLSECLALLGQIHWRDADAKKLIVIHPDFPRSIWTGNEGRNGVELIDRMYGSMLDNSGSDCWLSGGSMNLLKVNAIKWIMKENLPFAFSFPRLLNDNDGCAFHSGRIYFSIDDLIFPSLLINFCRLFDIGNGIRFGIYYIQALISYILSFFLSYILILLTKRDQLSSVVIYPILVISTMATGLIRGELRKLLQGTLTAFEERQKKERRDSF